jgi:predicted O-methyltransferase YrrM
MNDLTLRPPSRYQDQEELRWFVNVCRENNVRRYLEIGSRWGDSFFAVMANLKPGSTGIVVDLPENAEKRASVEGTMGVIRSMGQQAFSIFGDSRDPAIIRSAASYGPYDLVFIDGDHTYEGVTEDWENYGAMAPLVAFHDVGAPEGWISDGKPNGVPRFWRELKQHPRSGRSFFEFVMPGAKMGYGIVRR